MTNPYKIGDVVNVNDRRFLVKQIDLNNTLRVEDWENPDKYQWVPFAQVGYWGAGADYSEGIPMTDNTAST